MNKGSRRNRIKQMPISVIIPNLITVLALCSGLTGIRFALQDRWEFAIGAIALAAILDTLDGRMARLLKGQSKFGAELDSLSDFISFGVAPALILFFWSVSLKRLANNLFELSASDPPLNIEQFPDFKLKAATSAVTFGLLS